MYHIFRWRKYKEQRVQEEFLLNEHRSRHQFTQISGKKDLGRLLF